MKDYGLEQVHNTDLKILKEVDRICRKHGIRYMLDAGSLLGAVRHGGFIPWDDDADLVFTRENYEAFIKVVDQELPEGMHVIYPEKLRGGKAFYDFVARIAYDKSRIHGEQEEDSIYYQGALNHLFVDMFVLDELPDGALGENWTLLWQKIIYGFAMGHRRTLDYSKYSPFHKFAVGLLATIGKMLPMPTIFAWQHALSIKHNTGKNKRYYYSNYQPDYLYVHLQKDWCDDIVDIPFCDTLLMATSHSDQVLTFIYGDYMTFPPEDQRKPSHSTIPIEIFD